MLKESALNPNDYLIENERTALAALKKNKSEVGDRKRSLRKGLGNAIISAHISRELKNPSDSQFAVVLTPIYIWNF